MNASMIRKYTISLLLTLWLLCGAEPGAARPVAVGRWHVFRLTLADKAHSRYSLERPHEFLSERALERRARQHIALDSTDLPVSPAYVKAIARRGLRVVGTSKWNNTVLVRADTVSQLDAVRALPFVRRCERVYTSAGTGTGTDAARVALADSVEAPADSADAYGVAGPQLRRIGGDALHRRGWRGRGMMVAVIDAGFMNADRIKALSGADIRAVRDFVVPRAPTVFAQADHGTKVLSVMAAHAPGRYVGAAPEAAYVLARSENMEGENAVEQDFWAEAAEWADSLGADVVSSSLGYHAFDDSTQNVAYRQLDGRSTLVSRSAATLARKGVVVVSSAGNEGDTPWKKINVPADAPGVVAVGALDPHALNANFSSVGPTADGRVKPDVMATGAPAMVIDGGGRAVAARGTSFAAPQVAGLAACLWQAAPTLTASEIVNLLRSTASQAAWPDNVMGYGTADFAKALDAAGKVRGRDTEKQPDEDALTISKP